MIEQNKLEKFNSCNCCGRFNIQPETSISYTVLECGEIYNYKVGCIEFRVCRNCAYKLKYLLEKQLGEKK